MGKKKAENFSECTHKNEGGCFARRPDGTCDTLTDTSFTDGWCHFRKEFADDDGTEYDRAKNEYSGLIGLTLREALTCLPGDPGVAHIGARSAFMVIGNYDQIEERCDICEKENHNRLEWLHENICKEPAIPGIPPKKPMSAKVKWYEELYEKERARTKEIVSLFHEYEKRIKFMPLLERIVTDAYPRITGGYAIIVEGQEAGPYWNLEEWEKAHGGKEDDDITRETD